MADRERDERQRTVAAQQLEQQRMYKAEIKNSYKNSLDDQINQTKLSKQIEA